MMGSMDGVGLSSSEVEVMAKPVRRRFTAEYKLGVLREADACSDRGELGALLRREGLYSSHLTAWRKHRERGELQGLSRKRGPAAKQRNPLADKVRGLERENARLKRRAERAEGLVELQKKVSEILGIELKHNAEKD
jgi:transposase-like protein